MYRMRMRFKMKGLEGWNGFLGVVEEINAHAREKGWVQATAWTQSFGPFNEVELSMDYPDLATYERETNEFFADEKVTKLMTKFPEFVESGAGYSEMWQKADPVGS